MKKRLAAVLLTSALLVLPAHAAEQAPIDIQRHWAGPYISSAIAQGLMYPRPDGRFQPDHIATREEGAVVLYRLLQAQYHLPPVETAPPEATEVPAAATFPDTANRPSTQVLDALSRDGILTGYADGGFHPADPLTRGELAGMLYRTQPLVSTLNAYESRPAALHDITGDPNEAAIRFLCDRGILTGRPDGTFHPGDTITRGELAAVFCRLATCPPVPPPVELPERLELAVPYSSQIYPYGAWVGCEPTALYMALQYRGHATDVTLKQFLDDMPFDASNPARGFVGSPYVVNKKLRTTIYPPVLAEYGKKYGGDVVDFSGASPAELQAEVLAGNPVVVYLTMWWMEPVYSNYLIDGETQSLLYNNHAVLVTGYDCATGQYHITDPYNLKQQDRSVPYTYWVEGAKFDHLYTIRRHAVSVRG